MEKIILLASREMRYRCRQFLQELENEYEVVKPTGFGQKGIYLALGGDEILSELKNLGTPDAEDDQRVFVYFPIGENTDFARSLGLSFITPTLDLFKQIVAKQRFIDVPVMQCNGHRFINMAQIGSWTQANDQEGFLPCYRITCDVEMGREIRAFETLGCVIAQGLYGFGGIKLSEALEPWWGDCFEFLSIRGPWQRSQELISMSAYHMSIHADAPMPVILDDEIMTASSLHFSRDGGKLRFLLH